MTARCIHKLMTCLHMQPSGNTAQGGSKGPMVSQQHLRGLATLLAQHLERDELSLRLFEHQVCDMPESL